MNRVWVIKAEQRLSQLEERTKPVQELIVGLLRELSVLQARIAELEAKRGPGRPPKDKTE